MSAPRSGSSLALIVATRRMSSRFVTCWDWRRSSATAASTARSIPRRTAIGWWPAAIACSPRPTSACASTVAVVVPSPATSPVLSATSFSSCAPMFSNGFSSSISRAMVSPSLVIVGAPLRASMTTLRPRGPRVTRTAPASWSTPRLSAVRAASSNSMRLPIPFPPPGAASHRADARPG